jgi:hypothetical protein
MNSGKVYHILSKNLNNNLKDKDVQFNKYIITGHFRVIWNSYYNCKQNTERIKTYNKFLQNFFNDNKEIYKQQIDNRKLNTFIFVNTKQ